MVCVPPKRTSTGCNRYLTVQEGIAAAETFNAKGFSEKRVAQIHDVYGVYGAWIDMYRGAIPPLSVASGIEWESDGNPVKFKQSTDITETGLMSITEGVARDLNIDPFDPEANIWAGCHLRNDRARRVMQETRYSWLGGSHPYDWTKLVAKFTGSVGWGGWNLIMDTVFPSPPTPGSAMAIRPYLYMLDWLKTTAPMALKCKLGAMNPGCVALRLQRHWGTDWLERIGSLHVPGAFVVIPRPTHLPKWSESKWKKVIATPASKRLEKFPEYGRTPSGMVLTGKKKTSVVGGPRCIGGDSGTARMVGMEGVAGKKKR